MRTNDTFFRLIGRHRYDTVNLLDITRYLWIKRKLIFKWEAVGILVGLLICFSIPKEYTTTIVFVPEKEVNKNPFKDIVESLMSESMKIGFDGDAYTKNLYAMLIDSQDFAYDLLSTKYTVKEDDDEKNLLLKEYLKEEQKHPWWDYIVSKPFEALERLLYKDSRKGTKFSHTLEDELAISELQKRMVLLELERTGALQLEVTMQDPQIAALVADTILVRLDRMLTRYRKAKDIEYLKFTTNITNEAKEKFYTMLDSVAFFKDSNNNLAFEREKAIEQRLVNDCNLAQDIYRTAQMKQQIAKSNLLQEKNRFAVIAPSTVAIKASNPNKKAIMSNTMFLFAFIPVMFLIWHKKQ